ncbi:MAG TPA: beta-eliminating lyase-related protein, partial [Oscillospiraceae bacterium]|nr:beta-eliminating lyase-related protein [Oscillospiraceae bacterium]
MLNFKNDYSDGAHPKILAAMAADNLEHNVGYGCDPHCENAAALIRKACLRPDADVHFLVGGTQTNLVAISSALRPHHAVIAADTGHINVHETGSIEATGHKVLTAKSPDGKLTPELVAPILAAHTDEHMVLPRMVYISDSTEVGTLYTKAELAALSAFCREKGLLLYMDGARLADALAGAGNDLTLPDIAALTDAFYIGGTKCGALLGEALVLMNDAFKPDFRFLMKQRGAMLAKGFLIGRQFETLFSDGLYLALGRHADETAARLQNGFAALGYGFLHRSPTNQIFPVVSAGTLPVLDRLCRYEVWSPLPDGGAVVRLVTSWATAAATDPRAARRS